MPDVIHRLDIVHEAVFSQPAFGLLREFPTALRVFHETLSKQFTVNPEHISITSTNILSDLLIRIGLFNNTVSVELKADRMIVRLPNLNNVESLEIAKDTLALCYQALNVSFPDITLRNTAFVLSIWMTMEGGAEAAERLLVRNASPTHPLDAKLWGATTSRYGLRNISRNDSEGWTLTIFGEPSLVPAAHLFLSIDFTFTRNGMKSIQEQVAFGETRLPQVLTALGLNIPPDVKT